MIAVDLDKLESERKAEELLKIFNTMSFNGGNVKRVIEMDDNTIYLVMFNEPDLIFHFESMDEWYLRTAPNLMREHIEE